MNLGNLMGMGATAERAQNFEEAISYYNRVLEADPTVSAAWLGKGRAAGWLSSIAHLRINETMVAFSHAIATAGDDEKASVAEQAVADLTGLVETLYGLARRHFAEHGAVESARLAYMTAAARLSDALEEVSTWGVTHRPALDATVLISRDLLNLGVGPDMAAACRERMDRANAAILVSDPGYVPLPLAAQTLVEQEAEAIATAQQEAQSKANSDALGYIVFFIISIIGAVIAAASH